MITQEELKKQYYYCPTTGNFYHQRTHRKIKEGDIAGSSHSSWGNYIRISLGKGQCKLAHRLAYLYMWGYIPQSEIDHIDHNPRNNAWNNLRIVDHPTNGKNQKKYINNSSGVTGVRQRNNSKWRARIYHAGKHIDLGTYITFDEAVSARKQAEIAYNFHRNHGQ